MPEASAPSSSASTASLSWRRVTATASLACVLGSGACAGADLGKIAGALGTAAAAATATALASAARETEGDARLAQRSAPRVRPRYRHVPTRPTTVRLRVHLAPAPNMPPAPRPARPVCRTPRLRLASQFTNDGLEERVAALPCGE